LGTPTAVPDVRAGAESFNPLVRADAQKFLADHAPLKAAFTDDITRIALN
jgi:hypothetical protein